MSRNSEYHRDCLSCRIVSSTTLTCAGLFIGYHGYRLRGYSRASMLVIATLTAGFGVFHLLSPDGHQYGSIRTS